MAVEVEMPDDWDDHAGWELYYRALPNDEFWYESATTDPGSFSFDRLGSIVDDFREKNSLRIWFPGCGFSPLPRAFALLGFDVIASDISRTAIEYQGSNGCVVDSLVRGAESLEHRWSTDGSVDARVHDFRTSMGIDVVDVIFNVKAFQGLPSTSMSLAAQCHFAALCPGGVAIFDTMNVQGGDRDLLESILIDAGFYVPLANLNRWYRQSLTSTGIPHMFMLGRPVIPMRDDMPYPHVRGSVEYNRDVARLREISMEFESRVEPEYAKEEATVTDKTKTAHVVYSTG